MPSVPEPAAHLTYISLLRVNAVVFSFDSMIALSPELATYFVTSPEFRSSITLLCCSIASIMFLVYGVLPLPFEGHSWKPTSWLNSFFSPESAEGDFLCTLKKWVCFYFSFFFKDTLNSLVNIFHHFLSDTQGQVLFLAIVLPNGVLLRASQLLGLYFYKLLQGIVHR